MTAASLIAPLTKACKKCGEIRPLDHFPKCAAARDGRAGACRFCAQATRRANKTDEERARDSARARNWELANADRWRETKRKQSIRKRRAQGVRPKEEVAAEAAARREAEKIMKAQAREARQAERATKPWNAPGLSGAERWRLRYKHDPEFNLRERLRCQLRKEKRGERFIKLARAAIRAGGTSPTFEAAVGYSVAALRSHIERQFTRGMSWEAFCEGRIHIDHIVPIAAFNVASIDGFMAAWAMTNLRPMWAADNQRKAAHRIALL